MNLDRVDTGWPVQIHTGKFCFRFRNSGATFSHKSCDTRSKHPGPSIKTRRGEPQVLPRKLHLRRLQEGPGAPLTPQHIPVADRPSGSGPKISWPSMIPCIYVFLTVSLWFDIHRGAGQGHRARNIGRISCPTLTRLCFFYLAHYDKLFTQPIGNKAVHFLATQEN